MWVRHLLWRRGVSRLPQGGEEGVLGFLLADLRLFFGRMATLQTHNRKLSGVSDLMTSLH